MDKEIKSAAALLGKRGGHAAASKMTPAQRKARARLGGLARQKKKVIIGDVYIKGDGKHRCAPTNITTSGLRCHLCGKKFKLIKQP